MKQKEENVYLIVFFMLFLILASLQFYASYKEKKNPHCLDGTSEGECSLRKPYFCEEKKLIEKSSLFRN